MSRKVLMRLVAASALATLLIPTLIASAHQSVTAGNYVVEYGWLNEPALVGQPNAIVINIGPKETDASQAGGSISFVAPTNMAGVTGDKLDVSVKVNGLDAANSGMHWHLSVDEQVVAMVPIDQTTVTVSGLTNGMHTVTASLAAPDHSAIGQPTQTMIMVSGSSASGDPAAQDVQSMSMPADMNMDFTVDVSALKVEVAYGGQTKILQLQPLADGAPGQYVASFIPTKAGQYTVNLTGKLSGSNGDSDVNASVTPEEVEPLAGYAFPVLTDTGANSSSFGLTGWLAVAGLVAGLVGLALGAVALRRKK
jgi:hypothetical protein